MVAEKALGAQHTIHYPNATKKFRQNKQQNGANDYVIMTILIIFCTC